MGKLKVGLTFASWFEICSACTRLESGCSNSTRVVQLPARQHPKSRKLSSWIMARQSSHQRVSIVIMLLEHQVVAEPNDFSPQHRRDTVTGKMSKIHHNWEI